MELTYELVISLLASTLTTVSFVPQAWQIIKTKNTAGISLVMYIIFSVGVGFWLLLGIHYMNWPMIVANLVTLTLAFIILGLKIKFG